jgi:hypothetical protein
VSAPAHDDDAARASPGFPRFAEAFPRDPDLDALVAAFARGDYASVRTKAPELAGRTKDAEVARAAKELRARVEADPAARLLFAFTAALLAFLTVWWVAHDGPNVDRGKAPSAPARTIEYVK